jgi:potassium efflux system protein
MLEKRRDRQSLPKFLLFSVGLLLLLFSGICKTAFAQTETVSSASTLSLDTASQQLAIERQHRDTLASQLDVLRNQSTQRVQQLKYTPFDAKQVEQADLSIALAKASIDSTQLTLSGVEQDNTTVESNIQDLKTQLQEVRFPVTAPSNSVENKELVARLQTNLNAERELLKLQRARAAVLTETLTLAKQRLQFEIDWKTQVVASYQFSQREKHRFALTQQEVAVLQAQQQWLVELNQLNTQRKTLEQQGSVSNAEVARLSARIFEVAEQVSLYEQQLNLLKFGKQLDELALIKDQQLTITELSNLNQQADQLLSTLKKFRRFSRKKLNLIQEHKTILTTMKAAGFVNDPEASTHLVVLNNLASAYEKQRLSAIALIQKTQEYQDAITTHLTEALARRQGFPSFSVEQGAWLGQQILQLPARALLTLKTMQKQVQIAFGQIQLPEIIFMLAVEILWCGLWIALKRRLKKPTTPTTPPEYSQFLATSVRLMLVGLLRRNLTTIGIVGLLAIPLFFTSLPIKAYNLIIYLLLVWLGFKFAIGVARLVLLDVKPEKTKKDVWRYRMLKYLLSIGGILTILTVLVHQLLIPYELLDLFNRVFLLFLLVLSAILLLGWKTIPRVLDPYISGPRHYLRRTILILSFLIPLTVFFNAFIGFIGYAELAWRMSKYEGLFLLVLAGYLIAVELLSDCFVLLSKVLINRLLNGWLLSEALLKPLGRLLKLGLFIFAGYVLFGLYGWDENLWITKSLLQKLNQPLYTFAGGVITPIVLIELLIIVCITLWVAHWSREFAYRWLFKKMKDPGLRNSLAVFTQYTAVTAGVLFSLDIIGLDLNALKWIASFFALGIGFGLRDLSNNFISGILLLIERPLRKNDLVTIGDYEGNVTHIGMRSLTVYTGDHAEVLVPNSEVFSKAFTNWTHQDNVVRTVLNIKVAREDDPNLVRTTLLNVLKDIQGIVADPPPEVYFKSMDDALIEFEIHYFVNLQVTQSRLGMRSKVLFSIWEHFKSAGIQPAHPQQDIHVLTLPLSQQ